MGDWVSGRVGDVAEEHQCSCKVMEGGMLPGRATTAIETCLRVLAGCI